MARQKKSTTNKHNNQPASVQKRDAEEIAKTVVETPFALMRRFGEEMDRVFGDLGFGRGWVNPVLGATDLVQGLWTPQVEVVERDNQVIIRADLPGLTSDDIKVEATDDGITIQGERKQESEESRGGYYRSERSYGKFLRTVPLPPGVKAEEADATFRDGVLEITLPTAKREPQKSRRVEIRANTQPKARGKAA